MTLVNEVKYVNKVEIEAAQVWGEGSPYAVLINRDGTEAQVHAYQTTNGYLMYSSHWLDVSDEGDSGTVQEIVLESLAIWEGSPGLGTFMNDRLTRLGYPPIREREW